MRVNPLAGDEKSLLSATSKSRGDMPSGLRGKTMRRKDPQKQCQNILKTIVEGKVAIVVMSLVTVYALIGVSMI